MTPADIHAIRHRIKLPHKHPLHTTTQKELAELIQVSPQTIAAWETGRRKPSGAAKVLLQILAAHPALLSEISGSQKKAHLIPPPKNRYDGCTDKAATAVKKYPYQAVMG